MKAIGQPDDVQILRAAIRARLADVRTSVPGIVKSYDEATQTCEVALAVRLPRADGRLDELPPLTDVPVAWPRGGGYFAQMPLEQGDPGLLVFSEVDFSEWRRTGDVADPPTERRHGLNAYFIPGGCDDASPLPAPGGKLVVGKVGGPVMKIDAGGIELGASAAAFVALADKVDAALASIQSIFDAHVHPETGATTSPTATLIGTLDSVAASKVKAE